MNASRRALLRCLELALVIFLVMSRHAVAMAQPARAQGGPKSKGSKVTLSLQASPSDTPSHVCVVSFQAPAGNPIRVEGGTERPSLGLEPKAQLPDQPRDVATYSIDDNWEKLREGRDGSGWDPRTFAATNECSRTLAVCRPEFTLQDVKDPGAEYTRKHYIRCEANARGTPSGARQVAVVLIDVHTPENKVAEQPQISNIVVDGSTVTLDIGSFDDRTYRVVGSVIGGDYAESPARILQKERMELPLVRRCQKHEIALPPASRGGNADVTLRLGDATLGSFGKPVAEEGHFDMCLPYRLSHDRRSVEVAIGTRERDGYARYEGHWFDFEPPGVLKLRQSAISFHWRRDCLYTKEAGSECPVATLIETGGGCEGTWDAKRDECIYICAPSRSAPEKKGDAREVSPPEISFDLPVHVRFSGQDNIWTEELVYGNQLLTGFVPPEARHIVLDLTNVKAIRDRRAAKIDRIVVRDSNGAPRYIEPDENIRRSRKDIHPFYVDTAAQVMIDMPGVRCKDAITYQIEGERLHEEGTATVEDGGRVEIKDADKTEVIARPAFFVGVSFPYTRLLHADDRLAYRTGFSTLFVIGAAYDLRPRGWAFTFSPQYAFHFGSETYFPLKDGQNKAIESPERVLFARHLVDVTALVMFERRGQLGVTAGAQFSHPILTKDESRVSGAGIAFAGGLVYRAQFLDRWGLEGAFRTIWGEEVYAFQTAPLRGSPSFLSLDNVRLDFDLRLRFSL